MTNEKLREIWGDLVDKCHMHIPDQQPPILYGGKRHESKGCDAMAEAQRLRREREREHPAQDMVNDQAEHKYVETMFRKLAR